MAGEVSGQPRCYGRTGLLLDSFLNLVFPEKCLLCRAVLPSPNGEPFCRWCLGGVTPVGAICPRCERTGLDEAACSCSRTTGPLQMLFALTAYEGSWRNLLHDLKYRGKRHLARPLGRWLGLTLSGRTYCFPDLVVPVPLHAKREKERGFNQGALIARHAARSLGKPCREILQRHRDTPSQTAISRRGRRDNMRDAFCCPAPPPPGTTVLLVDDIYSTGATMKEAALTLAKAGVVVYGAVVSYNPPRHAKST